jgi:DNA-binding MarR family transcriptional regulator
MVTPVRYLFSQLNYLRGKKSRHILQQTGLSAGQPKILDFVSLHEGATQRELALGCGVEPATMSALLEGLEREGLVEKRGDAGNRRIVKIYLTEAGREKVRQIQPIVEALERETFGVEFSAEEQVLFRTLLERYCRRWQALDTDDVLVEMPVDVPHRD